MIDTLLERELDRFRREHPRSLELTERAKRSLLGGSEREKGRHRLYCDSDVERLRELIKLRDLLGVSLDDLRCLVVAEEGDLREALRSIEAQLELVCARHEELQRLENELAAKQRNIRSRLRALRE